MILRSGTYTEYKNKIQQLHRIMDRDGYYIYMHNKIDDKCIENEWVGYIRPVTPDEIGDIYSVRPYGGIKRKPYR